jgi:hypothetical protein
LKNVPFQDPGSVFGWVGLDDSHSDPELLFGESDRDSEVGVVGDDHGGVRGMFEGVEEEVGGEVHIRSLLFGFEEQAFRASPQVGRYPGLGLIARRSRFRILVTVDGTAGTVTTHEDVT